MKIGFYLSLAAIAIVAAACGSDNKGSESQFVRDLNELSAPDTLGTKTYNFAPSSYDGCGFEVGFTRSSMKLTIKEKQINYKSNASNCKDRFPYDLIFECDDAKSICTSTAVMSDLATEKSDDGRTVKVIVKVKTYYKFAVISKDPVIEKLVARVDNGEVLSVTPVSVKRAY